MKMSKGQLVAIVRITSIGLSKNMGRRDVAATIEHLGSFKDPSEMVDDLKRIIASDIEAEASEWETVQRLTINVEYKQSNKLPKDIEGPALKPFIMEFECNTLNELKFFIDAQPVKADVSEMEVSFVIKNKRDNRVVRYVARNFSSDVKYKGKVKASRISELASIGIAYYKDFKDIF